MPTLLASFSKSAKQSNQLFLTALNLNKIKGLFATRRELVLALTATVFFGAAGGIFLSTLNNYLVDVHSLGAEARGWLEFPRELPGFLVMFVSGMLLMMMRETQMAAVAMFFSALGAIGLGFLSTNTAMLVLFIIIWSTGDHIIFVVDGVIGLKLARDGSEGRRLGQFGGARNLGTIIGVGTIFLLAKLMGDLYGLFFAISAASSLFAGLLYIKLRVGQGDPPSRKIVFKKKYSIYYAISALFGIRKQIFLAFGGWVLVSLHDVPVSTIALLYFISAVIGVVFRPILGEIIDWMGERFILALDEIFLLMICLTYAFASDIFPAPYDLWMLYFTYVADWVLFALRVARTTYLKKIADDPSDITPTISMGITIDHVVAMSLPILSGYVWEAWGFRWVFIIAGFIAMVGFFVCLQIKNPKKAT